MAYTSIENAYLGDGSASRPRTSGSNQPAHIHWSAANLNETVDDDISREVYCVLGIPVDSYDLSGALSKVDTAANNTAPFLLSTPNLNFLVGSQTNNTFRQSLLDSDMCTADGMPLIWIAKLLGIPITQRIAGATLFEKLCDREPMSRPLRVFLFGGDDGVAEKAVATINASSQTVRCVGAINPGFGTIDDMSTDAIINEINDSKADFLLVALGAAKGQEWLLKNHQKLKVPVRTHLGACINFQAGTARRAPDFFQKNGLEWLWRIKEEPQLWRRYWNDGLALLSLTASNILPLAAQAWINRRKSAANPKTLTFAKRQLLSRTIISLKGDAVEKSVPFASEQFREAIEDTQLPLLIDLTNVNMIDQRFLGLLMMTRLQAKKKGVSFEIYCASPAIKKSFAMNKASYLLANSEQDQPAHSSEHKGNTPQAGIPSHMPS